MGKSGKYVARFGFSVLLIALCLSDLGPAVAGQAQRIVFDQDARNIPDGIFSMRPDGTGRRRLTTGDEFNPSWSPDGREIAYIGWNGNRTDLYKMNADGSQKRRLSSTKKNEFDPSWSPNGNKIVFVKEDDLFTMRANGSKVKRLTNTERDEDSPTWSSSGRIAFNTFRFMDWNLYRADLFTMNANGTDIARLTKTKPPEYLADWAPGGEWLAYSKVMNGMDQVFKMRENGEDATRLTKGGVRACGDPRESHSPSWSSDGDKIAFVGVYGGAGDFFAPSEIWTMRANGSRERRVVETTPSNCNHRSDFWHHSPDLR